MQNSNAENPKIIQTRQPTAKLISFTPQPLRLLAWVCNIYNQKPTENLELNEWAITNHIITDEDCAKVIEPFLQEPYQTFMEYIQTVWLFENVSRAFQQQLTRHRQASYAIQSLRVFDVGKFADEGRYTIPSTVKDKDFFHRQMKWIQSSYRTMTNHKEENLEDARGLLPLNVHSTITMRVDFNSLRHILQGRLCLTAQEEARKVSYLIKKEVATKMGKFFGDLLQPPCHAIYGGKCTREQYYCGVPLFQASTDPASFREWFEKTGGRPDGSRVPTNVVVLPEDIEVVKQAKEESQNEQKNASVQV